jgi:hypothetical protein
LAIAFSQECGNDILHVSTESWELHVAIMIGAAIFVLAEFRRERQGSMSAK